MSYARVETSVRTNRKFIKAGPAPSWLWLCGLLYCQDALTDGFIADETLDYLGVKNALRLASHLERAGLWDRVDGGWQIHDFLEHNKPAAEISRIRQERKEGGRLGGRKILQGKPSRDPSRDPSRLTMPETFPVYVDDVADVAAGTAVLEIKKEGVPLDEAFMAFRAAYPPHRNHAGQSERLYFKAIESGKTTPAAMMAALENHIASEQWQDPRHVPNMEKWLERESWATRMPPPKLAGTTGKTAGNADVLKRFVERHRVAN